MEGGLPYPLLKGQVYLSLFLYLFESYLQCLYLYQALEFHLVIQVYFIIFCFTLLCFVVVVSFCFLNWVCGNSAWSKSTGAIFPTAFAYFFYLHHILVILGIFKTFSWLSCYGDLWTVILAHFSIVEKYMYYETKKCVLLVIFILLQWSWTEQPTFPRYTCIT